MKIYITSYSIPGYAPDVMGEWLLSKDHEVHFEVFKNRFTHPGFKPITGHVINALKAAGKKARGNYDLAIAPDPSLIIGLHAARVSGRFKVPRLVYWRLDYYPKKYKGPFDILYQASEKAALRLADEVWSMATTSAKHVEDSLKGFMHKVKYVPYMMPNDLPRPDTNLRKRQALWIGPDRDNLRPNAMNAAGSVDCHLKVADYSIPNLKISAAELDVLLKESMVGIALYKSKGPKMYSDPARIHHYLAYGIPVVTTAAPPIAFELVQHRAGVIVDENSLESIREGISICIRDNIWMSEKAYKLSGKYLMSEEVFGITPIPRI